MYSRLDDYDTEGERDADWWWSAEAAETLSTVYQYAQARNYALVERTLNLTAFPKLSLLQEIRIWYMLALANYHLAVYPLALQYADYAISCARTLGDPAILATITRLAGTISHELQGFRRAQHYFLHTSAALDACLASATDDEKGQTLALLVSDEFLIGQYDTAMTHVQRARELLAASHQTLVLARLHWLEALICRWHGDLDEAERAIARAAHGFMQPASEHEKGRLLLVQADIALDYAERVPATRDIVLARAEDYVRAARRLLQMTEDHAGMHLANLTTARFMYVSGGDHPAEAVIKDASTYARAVDDFALLGQAYTHLGYEALSRQSTAVAMHWFSEALEIFSRSDAEALQQPAQRALWNYQEMSEH